jgi:exopolyphosphatase/guanosine-5'-triphosphate,3'-diphosphate pyrophosphatase
VTSGQSSVSESPSPLAEIVPRWEWRTFGGDCSDVEEAFAKLGPERVQESDELYLVSLDTDASVKVRDGLMDMKHREHVNDDGLEQWRPVMKAAFPLSAGDVGSLLSTLGLTSPPHPRDAYTLDQLLDELVRPSQDVRAVGVHKRRDRHTIDGCMIELTTLRTEGATTRTIAVEAEDPALVMRTLRSLNLDSRPNVCLARGLKALIGFDAVRYAVIDVGTNSVKFHIGERRPNNRWRTIVDSVQITKLGESLDQAGLLDAKAIERTADAIVAMIDQARRNGVAAIAAVGTAGLRIASNASALIDLVRDRSGVQIEVISGDEEARLSFIAATAALPRATGSFLVFETGGGSSQFSFGRGAQVDERFSLDIGAIGVTERLGLGGIVSPDELDAALATIAAELERLDGHRTPDALVALGGAVTNLAAVKHELAVYDPEVVQGTILTRAEVRRQIDLYSSLSAEERRRVVGLQPARAEVILAGACIVLAVLEKLDCDSLTVSDRGVRHGLLTMRFGTGDAGAPEKRH